MGIDSVGSGEEGSQSESGRWREEEATVAWEEVGLVRRERKHGR